MSMHRPARLTSAMVVSLLCRQVSAAGGFAAVLHRGDEAAGAIMLECMDRGQRLMMLERAMGPDGEDAWRSSEPAGDDAAQAQMLERRRRTDPDLWVVELDIADPERFVARLFD